MIKRHNSKKNNIGLYTIFVVVLVFTLFLCISIGSVHISFKEIVSIFANKFFGIEALEGFSPQSEKIVLTLRAPRVVLAMVVGSALSVCGAVMQGLIKNPLADSSILGITAGGSLGAVISLAFNFTLPIFPQFTTPIMAISFSMLSLIVILSITYSVDKNLSSNTILLTGIIFSMFVNSIVTIITSFSGDKLRGIVFWTMGSFVGRSWNIVIIGFILISIGIIGVLLYCRELDAFSMGEEQAKYAGVNVKKARLMLLLFVSILCGTSVSICGNIAFVGLIIPHILRMAFGPLHIKLIPLSIFGGAIFMALCDLLARTILSPIELPVGVITSLFGSIVFIYIFYSSNK